MSDAPKGVSERMLRLTGFPEQVQAAMNLVQVDMLLQACHPSKQGCMNLWHSVGQHHPQQAKRLHKRHICTRTCNRAIHQPYYCCLL